MPSPQSHAGHLRKTIERVQGGVSNKVIDRRSIRIPPSSPLISGKWQAFVGMNNIYRRQYDVQYNEFPRLLIFLNIRASFNVQQDEQLHTTMVFAKAGSAPCRL